MPEPAFDYLSGVVRVPYAAPSYWEQDGLDAFYEHPNHPDWGAALCRVLYHESIHFWQFLASGYVANLVAEEWDRLRQFEESGTPPAASAAAEGFVTGTPFSAYELTECWARYWDVHTHSPTAIIAEDDLLRSKVGEGWSTAPAAERAYKGEEFDLVMQEGRDCALYAAPYRWALDLADGASYLVGLTFPSLCHAAFGSPRPVDVFVGALERVVANTQLRNVLTARRTGNINTDWLATWPFLVAEAVEPALRSAAMPIFTSGLDVISRSQLLADHPVFPEYLQRAQILQRRVRFEHQMRGAAPHDALLSDDEIALMWESAIADPWVMFGLPGQPIYRAVLGASVPPPRVQFADFAARAPLMPQDVGSLLGGGETPTQRVDNLLKRVRRFRHAETAVALGLPATAFDTAL